MTNHDIFAKVSATIESEYDIFEEFADGSAAWRCVVIGMKNAELKIQELSSRTDHKFFALNFLEPNPAAVRPGPAKRVINEQNKLTA